MRRRQWRRWRRRSGSVAEGSNDDDGLQRPIAAMKKPQSMPWQRQGSANHNEFPRKAIARSLGCRSKPSPRYHTRAQLERWNRVAVPDATARPISRYRRLTTRPRVLQQPLCPVQKRLVCLCQLFIGCRTNQFRLGIAHKERNHCIRPSRHGLASFSNTFLDPNIKTRRSFEWMLLVTSICLVTPTSFDSTKIRTLNQ